MSIKEPYEGKWFVESESELAGGDGETDLVTRLSHSVSRVKAFDMRIRLEGVSWEESFVWRCV